MVSQLHVLSRSCRFKYTYWASCATTRRKLMSLILTGCRVLEMGGRSELGDIAGASKARTACGRYWYW